MAAQGRSRLDAEMVRRGLVSSRAEAADLIARRAVMVSGSIALKASRLVGADEPILLTAASRFVSRGGEKLDAALEAFSVVVEGRSAVDAGSSTGGFTDCLLQRGAARVFAVDVGRNQLHERIARDPRVTFREGTNVRKLKPADLPFRCSLLVADLSFISLVTVLPALVGLVEGDREMILLVKPQFEVGRIEASRGRGVITDPVLHRRSIDRVVDTAGGLGWQVEGEIESPIKGQEGNTEFLLRLRPLPGT